MMFQLITQVIGLNSLHSLSSTYSYECISVKSDFGKDVWIQYYKNEKAGTSVFKIDNSVGGFPSIMLYVENDDEKSSCWPYMR